MRPNVTDLRAAATSASVGREAAAVAGDHTDSRPLLTEGIWAGPSGGANLVAALRIAQRLGAGHRVVTVQPDSG